MLKIISILLIFSSCGDIKEVTPITKQDGTRYKVHYEKPPVIFSDAIALNNIRRYEPFLLLLNSKQELFNSAIELFMMMKPKPRVRGKFLGYGLDQKLSINHRNPNDYIHKTSMIWGEKGEDLKIDYIYKDTDDIKVETILSSDFIDCRYKIKDGFSCRKSGYNKQPPGEWKTIWDNKDDPVTEMSIYSYSGIYAITKTGKLITVKFAEKEGLVYPYIHKDLTFRKNSDNRYFINARGNYLCMQTIDKTIYCLEQNFLEHRFTDYGLVNKAQPLLAKVTTLDFFAKEVAFGGRHFCFLSEEGDIYCQGDNGCGQVTSRHDEEQYVKEITKVNFLNDKAKSIISYASGNCALLVNGDVQCWGLGASVIREKLLDDDAYDDSYRPWQVCLGGAENGI